MNQKKKGIRVFSGKMRHRRQWLAFVRMCRYGVNNFSRNAWLTIAATAVMTITLLIVFITVTAQSVLSDTTAVISKRIDRSIYLKTGTTEAQAQNLITDIGKLPNVTEVRFVSSEMAREEFAKQNKTKVGTLDALNQATNKLPATIKIGIKNANDTTSLVNYVKTSKELKKSIDPNRSPTFMSERKSATDTIAGWTRAAQQVGIGASIVFVSISALIIFNTIRMAIFNRKEEIQMMKLIGAERSFIRGPFVVEAIVYGFIAAIVATSLGVGLIYATTEKLQTYGVEMAPTIDFLTTYIGLVLMGMILLGALVGTLSSLLATRRYLKIE